MVANNSRKNFLAFYKNMREMRKEIKDGLARNIKDACEVMIEAAQENTPPCKGERRGTEAWTVAAYNAGEHNLERATDFRRGLPIEQARVMPEAYALAKAVGWLIRKHGNICE